MTKFAFVDRNADRCGVGSGARVAACVLLVAAALSPIEAQGLRSASASVSLVVTKPAAATMRDVELAIPQEWRGASDILVRSSTSTAEPGHAPRLFVRDRQHRLVELDPRTAAVSALVSPTTTITLRWVAASSPAQLTSLVVDLQAVWPDGRREALSVPVRSDEGRP